MGDELGTEISAACSKLRRVLQEKTGDGRLRDLETWLDYDGKSVFIAALWSDDEASVTWAPRPPPKMGRVHHL